MRILAAALCLAPVAEARARDTAMLFGGVATDAHWEEFVISPGDVSLSDSGLIGVAFSREIAAPHPRFTVEVEAQLVRHFGAQDHWEFNLPIVMGRWRAIPSWDASAAFGLGFSFATETPALEVAQEGESTPTMAYWAFELESATPIPDTRLIGRLHHRSTAYGLFGEDGGLNALVVGLRKRF